MRAYYSAAAARRKRDQLIMKVACVTVLLTLVLVGGYANWIAYGNWVCETVPNHYTCEVAK